MAVTSFGSASAGLQPYEQIFTSSGTWTKPAGVKTVEVTCVGGGGSGQQSYASTAGGGGGVFKGIVDVSSLSTVPVTIGAGGNRALNTVSGATGGITSFGSLVAATGGVGAGLSNYSAGESGTWYYPNVSGKTTILATSGATLTASGIDAWQVNAGVAWNGSYYIAVYGNVVKKSTDGLAWTTVTTSGLTSSVSVQYPSQMAYANGLFVIGSINTGSTKYATSPDGTTWTERTIPGTGVSVNAISYANGRWYLGTNQAPNSLYYSTDAINWTACTTNAGSSTVGRVAYGNGVYVATKNYSPSYGAEMLYSSDGITWTLTSYQVYNNPGVNAGVIFLNGKFYAWSGQLSYSGSGNTQLWSSTNGQTWTGSTSAMSDPIINVAHTTGGLMAILQYSNQYVYYTKDGLETGQGWITNFPMSIFSNGTTITAIRGNTSNGAAGTLSGFDGAGYSYPGGSNNPYSVGGSFGGHYTAINVSSNVYISPTIDGYGRGGQSNTPPLAPGDGGFANNYDGKPGIVKIRWWA